MDDYILFKQLMADFFTPVEISKSSTGEGDRYDVEKYNNDPFSPTTVRIESLGDHRRKVINWLKSMPVASRVKKLTFTNKQFACLLITMFDRVSTRGHDCLQEFALSFSPEKQLISYCSGFRIAEERFIPKPNPELLQAENKLISSILVANRYSRYDSVTVDFGMAADINALFDLFDVIENGISHQLSLHNCQNYNQESNSHALFYNPLDHDCSITKTLGLWFVEVIKKNLCLQYFQENLQANFKMLQDSQFEKAMDSRKEKQRELKKCWDSMAVLAKEKLIRGVLTRDIRAVLSDYRHTIKVSGDSFPFMKYCHQDQFEELVESMTKIEGGKLMNKLTYTKISDCSFDVTLYKYDILLEAEIQAEKQQLQWATLNKSKLSKLPQKNKKSLDQRKTIQVIQQNKEMEQIFQQNPPQDISKVLIVKKSKKGKKMKPNQYINLQTGKQDESSKDLIEDEQQILAQRAEQRKKKAEECFTKIAQQFNSRTGKWHKYQNVAINRLASVLAAYNLSCQVFGSCSSGLAVPCSDIDISVSPTIVHYFSTYFCTYREKLIMSLRFLWGCFQTMEWAGNFNLITTASVPVLVFEVDLSKPFGDPANVHLNASKISRCPKISIDLTIEPFADMEKELVPHLGYESTLLVRDWLIQFNQMKDMVRILKYILMRNDLNKSFRGGLSSYALTSIVYTFMRVDPQKKQQSTMDLLAKFCQFIANFDEKSNIISTSGPEPFVKKQVGGLTVQNYLNGRNITENCYRFKQIKLIFGQAYRTLESYLLDIPSNEYEKRLRYLLLL